MNDDLLALLVARVAEECGAAVDEVRRHAIEITTNLSDARIQAFLPLLIEKNLRARFRRHSYAD
ncbi:MAG: hypothetical protein ACJ735_16950 [Actinomycetes bacterium]